MKSRAVGKPHAPLPRFDCRPLTKSELQTRRGTLDFFCGRTSVLSRSRIASGLLEFRERMSGTRRDGDDHSPAFSFESWLVPTDGRRLLIVDERLGQARRARAGGDRVEHRKAQSGRRFSPTVGHTM